MTPIGSEPVYLSDHFTLQELSASEIALRLGLPNQPDPASIENLKRVAALLEQVRTALSVPLHVNSGFRSGSVNHAVGGAVNSAHMDGRAADVVPMGLDLRTAFNILRNSAIRFDQLIIECNAWLHLSVPKLDVAPRGMALIASGGPGHWIYEPAPA